MAMCAFRFPRLITSGPPAKEPKGGVPVWTCPSASADGRASRIKSTGKGDRRVRNMCVSSASGGRSEARPLHLKIRGGQAGVEGGGLELQIQDEAVVQVLLNAEGDLCSAEGTVVGKANLDGYVESGVIVRMRVKG